MAKKKAPELPPEAKAANAAGENRRDKEKQARQRNAEKQKRFRDSMKAEGYRRVTLWDLPCPGNMPCECLTRLLSRFPGLCRVWGR
jgi:hypothetical protein